MYRPHIEMRYTGIAEAYYEASRVKEVAHAPLLQVLLRSCRMKETWKPPMAS